MLKRFILNDEIVAASPNIYTIIEFLGLKLIEYLDFISGDFQQNILTCEDISIISEAFYTLFPSYRFPELKIPSKIPTNSAFTSLCTSAEDKHLHAYQLHHSVMKGDVDTVKRLVEEQGVDINLTNGKGETALHTLLSHQGGYKGHQTVSTLMIHKTLSKYLILILLVYHMLRW